MQLKSLFALAFFAVFSVAQTTPTQVESDITNGILPRLSTVLTAIEAFPTSGGTLDQVMALHNDDDELNDAIVAVTDDITRAACPFSDSDAQTILTDLEGLSPGIQTALTDIVKLKPDFDTLGATSLILQDLTTLKVSSDAMGAALVACVSSNVTAEVEQFVAGVDTAFAPAISTFS